MSFKRPLSIALGALATTALGGCYYGDVYGSGYGAGGDCAARYGDTYYDADGYAYDDGYGYDCYDAGDYSGGFAQIGFGGGWYDDYYYPGYGLWMYDNYHQRYPLRGQYLNYWGGRRAWWKHHPNHGNGPWQGGHGNGHGGRNGPGNGHGNGDGHHSRPGGWHGGDHDGQPPHGTRPPRGPGSAGAPPPGTGRPTNGTRPRGPEVLHQPRPAPTGNVRPAIRPQATPATPVVRSNPPPPKAARVRPAPQPRSRADRPNHVREQ